MGKKEAIRKRKIKEEAKEGGKRQKRYAGRGREKEDEEEEEEDSLWARKEGRGVSRWRSERAKRCWEGDCCSTRSNWYSPWPKLTARQRAGKNFGDDNHLPHQHHYHEN